MRFLYCGICGHSFSVRKCTRYGTGFIIGCVLSVSGYGNIVKSVWPKKHGMPAVRRGTAKTVPGTAAGYSWARNWNGGIFSCQWRWCNRQNKDCLSGRSGSGKENPYTLRTFEKEPIEEDEEIRTDDVEDNFRQDDKRLTDEDKRELMAPVDSERIRNLSRPWHSRI